MAHSQCMHSSLQSCNNSGGRSRCCGGCGIIDNSRRVGKVLHGFFEKNFKDVAAVKFLQWQKNQ